MSDSDKADALTSVLSEINTSGNVEKVPKTIIFVSRKHACDKLANSLWDAGYSVDSLVMLRTHCSLVTHTFTILLTRSILTQSLSITSHSNLSLTHSLTHSFALAWRQTTVGAYKGDGSIQVRNTSHTRYLLFLLLPQVSKIILRFNHAVNYACL